VHSLALSRHLAYNGIRARPAAPSACSKRARSRPETLAAWPSDAQGPARLVSAKVGDPCRVLYCSHPSDARWGGAISGCA
jgi:hypothetical protein